MKKVAMIILLELILDMPVILAVAAIVHLGFNAQVLEKLIVASTM